MPAQQDFSIYQGDTFEHTFEIHQGGPTGPLFDLTGYDVKMQVRSTAASDTAILSLTLGSGIVVNTVTGTIFITLSAAQTLSIPYSKVVYDLEISLAGKVSTLIFGVLTITPGVTR